MTRQSGARVVCASVHQVDEISKGRRCINLARAGEIYANDRGASPPVIRSDSSVTFLSSKKIRKGILKAYEPKTRYRVRNWAPYNPGRINLETQPGNVTI
ncbi:MAG: hypothetical protein E5299_00139 [Burkholderia gladioli]|nr:MAG: hypothetical protein E5299_00139 [Burkholderia gladioli]